MRYRAGVAYITGTLADGEPLPLCYTGSAHTCGVGALPRPATTTTKTPSCPTAPSPAPPDDALNWRLRALPQRLHRLDINHPDELTGATTSYS